MDLAANFIRRRHRPQRHSMRYFDAPAQLAPRRSRTVHLLKQGTHGREYHGQIILAQGTRYPCEGTHPRDIAGTQHAVRAPRQDCQHEDEISSQPRTRQLHAMRATCVRRPQEARGGRASFEAAKPARGPKTRSRSTSTLHGRRLRPAHTGKPPIPAR